MKKHGAIGFIVGLTVGVAGDVATAKVVNEIKNDFKEKEFTSPNGDNTVMLKKGSSKFAKGLSYIKVCANKKYGRDECKLSLLAGNNAKSISCEWEDNEHCHIVIGKGKVCQYVDIDFTGREIKIVYYWKKIKLGQKKI